MNAHCNVKIFFGHLPGFIAVYTMPPLLVSPPTMNIGLYKYFRVKKIVIEITGFIYYR